MSMRSSPSLFLSFCNEMLADEGLSLEDQCRVARALGYRGLELAPGSLAYTPHTLKEPELRDMRARIEGSGMQVTGLHWLLARGIPAGMNVTDARDAAAALFQVGAVHASSRGVTYCIEPLSRAETTFINTVEEGFALVQKVGSPAFQTMIDTSAAGQSETQSVADLVTHWVPKGCIAHIQVNDTNRGAPGTGEDPFEAIVAALHTVGWDKPIAVEPFQAVLNATTTAAIGAATMQAHSRAVQANAGH